MLAMRAESRRLICPAPTPMVMPPLQNTNGVGFDVLGHRPGKKQIIQLVGRGLAGGHHFEVGQRQLMVVCGLQQNARANALHVHEVAPLVPGAVAPLGQVNLQDAHVHLGLEHLQGLGRKAGRHQHFDKLFGNLQRCGFVQHGI
jgi:hypothetical protein